MPVNVISSQFCERVCKTKPKIVEAEGDHLGNYRAVQARDDGAWIRKVVVEIVRWLDWGYI